jgi:anti-sigma-K factor RskA
MTCEELRPDYLLYALGVLEDPERTEVRVHLDRGCQDCAAGVREAREWAYAMGASLEGPAPPRQLRSRILAAAGAKPARNWSWFPAWVACGVTALVAAGVVVYQAGGYRRQVTAMRGQITRAATEAAGLREALALIESPDTREVTFGQGQPAPPRGRVFVNPAGVLLVASNLPAPPPGKIYEMWIIRRNLPAPAGLFSSDAQGNAFHFYRPSTPAATGDIVAVTLEMAGGVNAPTTTPIIGAAL